MWTEETRKKAVAQLGLPEDYELFMMGSVIYDNRQFKEALYTQRGKETLAVDEALELMEQKTITMHLPEGVIYVGLFDPESGSDTATYGVIKV